METDDGRAEVARPSSSQLILGSRSISQFSDVSYSLNGVFVCACLCVCVVARALPKES